jgi:hypothetical protein
MWKTKKPVLGDHIRVSRGLYYHHGIYADDYCVFHFASPSDNEMNPETARVLYTTLDGFLKGGTLEVREYTFEESNKKRNPKEVIDAAIKSIGEGGYNVISNNCEHFANRCIFGEAKSEQVDNVKELLRRMFG